MVGNHGHAAEVGTGSLIGLAIGYVAKGYAFGMLAAPGWFPYVIQGTVTLIVASITVVVTHFLKRWLDGRFPNPAKKD